MKNIKKILIAVGIIILIIVGIFIIRKCSTKEVVIKSLSEQIYEVKTISEFGKSGSVWDAYEVDENNNYVGIVEFGSYYHPEYDRWLSIDWIVLEKDEKNKKALLFSADVFDQIKYSNDPNDATWENSNLRDFLNGDFLYTSFSDSERNNILETPLINSANPLYGTSSGQNTIDKIFALSCDYNEIYKYFPGSHNENGNFISNLLIPTQSKTYYLRTAGAFSESQMSNMSAERKVLVVDENDGTINMDGIDVCSDAYVRPAMWVKYYPDVESNSKNIEDSYIQKNRIESEDLAIQASKVKCVTEYSKNTVVKKMDTVKFGSYPQSGEIGVGNEPIEWIVLEKNNNEMLLLSKYILDCKCFNDEDKEVTWETCTLRKWLNDAFYNYAFSTNEKEKIVKSVVKNKENVEYGTSGGNDTVDFVYLLSNDECIKFFGNIDNRHNNKCLATNATEYAKNIFNNGRQLYVKKTQRFSWDYGNSEFWLRSPAENNYFGKVWSHGEIYGAVVNYCDAGVRPLIRVKY